MIAAAFVLLLAAAILAHLAGLGTAPALLRAGARAAVQLLAVALLVGVAFTALPAAAAFLGVMVGVAAVTSGRRMTAVPQAIGRAALAILAGVLPALAVLVATGAVEWEARALLPVGGILIGGAMTATSLAGRRLLADLAAQLGQVEAALALGMPPRAAGLLAVGRSAAREALVPALDQTRTVGLVTLPGTFVGLLLGGASPAEAAALQLLVLLALLLVEVVAAVLTVELVLAALRTPWATYRLPSASSRGSRGPEGGSGRRDRWRRR